MKKWIYISFVCITCLDVLSAQDSIEIMQVYFYKKVDTTWTLVAKEGYRYDEWLRLVSVFAMNFENDQWRNHLKTDIKYPEVKNDTNRIEKTYEANEGIWGDPYRNIYFQNKKGEDISVVTVEKDSITRNWVPQIKGDFKRDKKGNILEKLYTHRDSTGWINQDRMLYTYDAKGNKQEEEFQVWENDQWQSHKRSVFFWNDDQTIRLEEVYQQDKSTGKLSQVSTTRINYEYDPGKNLIRKIIQSQVNGAWVDQFKRENKWGNPLANIKPATQKPIEYFKPKWSPDGSAIVYESRNNGKSSINTIYADGSHPVRVTDSLQNYIHPSWSPDGTSIIYSGGSHPLQLYFNKVSGGAEQNLRTPGFDAYEPDWSTNGMIVFNSRHMGRTDNDISVIKEDGSGFKTLTDGTYDCTSPHWSPDGKSILFKRTIAIREPAEDITAEHIRLRNDSSEICIMNPDGTGLRNLTKNNIMDLSPIWSKDGTHYYYISLSYNGQAIFSSTSIPGQSKIIYTLDESVTHFDISPDGRQLVFASSKEGPSSIYIYDLHTKTERKLIGN